MLSSMHTKKRAGRIASIAGTVAIALLDLAGIAQAMPDDHPDFDAYCTPAQVQVSITPLSHAMMHEGADVRFDAKPGESCLLSGAPGVTFLDGQGEPLGISAEYPRGQAPVHTLDVQHPVSAAFSYQVTDPNTGHSLPGPTPTSIEVAFPAPLGAYTVTVPWNGATVPGPVSVNNVGPAQG